MHKLHVLLAMMISLMTVQPSLAAHVRGELLVKLKPGASERETARAEKVIAEAGGRLRYAYRLVPGLRRLTVPAERDLSELSRALLETGAVEYAHPSYLRRVALAPGSQPPRTSPVQADPPLPSPRSRHFEWVNDPRESSNYGVTQNRVKDVWRNPGWIGHPLTVIAVLDTGIDYRHRDLVDNLFRNPHEIAGNGIDDDANGYVDDVMGWDFINRDALPFDDHGHGTHVSGIAAATGGNGYGISGHCPRCTILPLKFIGRDGSGSDADAIQALEYAVEMGAAVTNSSWGSSEANPALEEAFRAVSRAGIQSAVAAGNDGADLSFSAQYPARYIIPGLFTVAALTEVPVSIPSWSNYGPSYVHLSSAGLEVTSTLPDNTFGRLSGTSMAAPAVAGDLAMIRSYWPAATHAQVRALFEDRDFVLLDTQSMVKTRFHGRPDMKRLFDWLFTRN